VKVEVEAGARVAEFMFDNGLATVERPSDIRAWVEGQLYHPQY
jgi:malate dehydrogenase (oxaloacetate-decarboxylating)(NADP+)